MANTYYSGQGSVYASPRSAAGVPTGFIAIGNVPELEISIEVTKYEHKESESGSRAVDLAIVQEKKGTFRMLVENISLANLAMGFWGQESPVVAVTDDESIVVSPTALTEGMALGFTNISTGITLCTVDYASGTPTITYLVTEDAADRENTAYDYYVDLKYGVAYPIAGALTNEPALGEDVYVTLTTAVDALTMEAFTEDSMERYVRFEGLNTISGEDDVLIEMYKVQLDPISGYQLINEEIAQLEITGSLLYDDKQVSTSKYFKQTIVT